MKKNKNTIENFILKLQNYLIVHELLKSMPHISFFLLWMIYLSEMKLLHDRHMNQIRTK